MRQERGRQLTATETTIAKSEREGERSLEVNTIKCHHIGDNDDDVAKSFEFKNKLFTSDPNKSLAPNWSIFTHFRLSLVTVITP